MREYLLLEPGLQLRFGRQKTDEGNGTGGGNLRKQMRVLLLVRPESMLFWNRNLRGER